MRVIAGTRKSLPLKTIPGENTRPTTDRIKETLFNMLNPYLYGCRFLDLFAGSGGIGIEALSRGAKFCCFVEQNPRAAACIRDNLKKTGFENEALLLQKDVRKIAELLAKSESYDIVFMDPPYNRGLEQEAITALAGGDAVHPETLFVIEASVQTDFSWAADLGLEILREKKYKTNKHIFLKKKQGEDTQVSE